MTRLRDRLSQARRDLPWVKVDKESVVHFGQRDVTMVAISRAPFEKLEAFRKRMGWSFKWVSSFHTDFNRDYHVTFSSEELAAGKVFYNYAPSDFGSPEAPGISVFHQEKDGSMFHTYSCYGRGLDAINGAYQLLDLVPKGRDEGLPYTMAWVRYHDSYDARVRLDTAGRS